jgi:hypothetical protein
MLAAAIFDRVETATNCTQRFFKAHAPACAFFSALMHHCAIAVTTTRVEVASM